MKSLRNIAVAIAAVLLAVSAHAQVRVVSASAFSNQTTQVSLKVVDSLSNEPISYVSVYLVPVKDTIITNFAITDSTGSALIRDVAIGGYKVNAELIGYKPYCKEIYFRNWREDLGTIKLQEDIEWLSAAKIVAAGNPVEVKGDTIVFNAAMFKVGENSMLEDMLKKMPGFEVSSDGQVKLNGEPIEKITVGGRTFFFDDPSVAVKNLPAKIVDKVKVIDQEGRDARITGIEGERKKVMDLDLKEEYKKGFFGNIALNAGTSIVPDDPDGKALVEGRDLLFNGNVLASRYTEKDQLTFFAEGSNVEVDGLYFVSYSSSDDILPTEPGLTTSGSAGLNWSNTGMKNFETAAMAKYSIGETDSRSRKSRTTLLSGNPDIRTDSESQSLNSKEQVGVQFELKDNEAKKKDWYLDFSPSVTFNRSKCRSERTSGTQSAAGELVNDSYSLTGSHSNTFSTSANLSGGLSKLGKDKGNSLTGRIGYSFSNSESYSSEYTRLEYGSGLSDIKDMSYDGDSRSFSINGMLNFVQKLTDKARLSVRGSYSFSRSGSERDAFDIPEQAGQPVPNDYYSSFSNTTYNRAGANALYQYRNGAHNLQAGLRGEAMKKVTTARSLGVTTTSGADEILWNWSPELSYSYRKSQNNFNVRYSGNTTQPNQARILPVLNINDRTNISAGNIYLKPSISHTFYISGWGSNKEKYSSWDATVRAGLNQRQFVTASWMDEKGVRNSFQVNSAKPSSIISLYCVWDSRFGKEKQFSIGISPNVNWNSAVSYQAQGRLKGFDVDNFDYTGFIREFWGNTDEGENFYSGKSGFRESRTRSVHMGSSFYLRYKNDYLSLWLSESPFWRINRYTVDPTANTDVFDNSISLSAEYYTPGQWEFDNYLAYSTHHGYSDGYGDPVFTWNFNVSKSVKAFTFSFSINDILNQRTSLSRTVQEDFVEDSYRNILGRYFLFGIKWNFGKMNAAQGRKAQGVQFDMMNL